MPNRSFAPLSCLAACLLGACGGESESPPAPPDQPGVRDFTDGQRLSGRFVATLAGESQQVGIFDRVTGLECAFELDETERLRCLPHDPDGTRFWQAFADAGCQVPLWYATDRRSGPPMATVPAASGRGHEVRPVEILSAPAAVFGRSNAGCEREPALEAGTAVLGARVDPARFAAGTAGPRAAPGRSLAPWQIEGEDGSRFPVGLYDVAGGHGCRAVRLDGQTGLCLEGPLASAGSPLFADGACTREVVFAAANETPASFLVGAVPRAVAGRWEGGVWQLRDDGVCQATERYQVFSYYLAGEVLHPPRLTFAFEGQGRVKREVLRDERGELLGGTGALVEGSGASLRDSDNGGDCATLLMPDGSFRCVSINLARVQAGEFADPGCRVPTIQLIFTPGGTGPSGVIALVGEGTGPWEKVAAVHAVGATTNALYEGSPAACAGPRPTKASATPLGEPLAPPAFELLVTNRR
jgi:hypothetical protein